MVICPHLDGICPLPALTQGEVLLKLSLLLGHGYAAWVQVRLT